MQPEVIYHLAGWADVGGSWQAPVEAFRANAEGTLNVLQRGHRRRGRPGARRVERRRVRRPCSEAELPLTEDSPLRPASPYAASKVAADFLGLQAWLGRRLPVLRVRAFNHLGPGQTDKFVAPALASRIARDEREGGDVLTIGNLVGPPRLHRRARRRAGLPAARRARRAGRGLQRVLRRATSPCRTWPTTCWPWPRRPMRFETDPELLRPVDVPVLRGDHARLTEATGWEPEIPLAQTLTDLLDDWRTRVC